MKEIAINLATRGRPELAFQTAHKTMMNAKGACHTTRMIISIDEDDEESVSFFRKTPLVFARVDIRPREDSTGEKFNRVLKLIPDADLYIPMVDYVAQITPSWDQEFLRAASIFPDGIGVVCNHLANASFPFTMAPTKRLVQKLGHIFPPYFPYWFVDHWLHDIARLINRYSFAETDVEIFSRPIPSGHHPTMEYREIEFWSSFFDTGYFERRSIANSIIDDPEFLEPGWRKELLRRNHPLVEVNSFWINRILRQSTPPEIDNGPGDGRYWRLRDQAVRLSRKWLQESSHEGSGSLYQ